MASVDGSRLPHDRVREKVLEVEAILVCPRVTLPNSFNLALPLKMPLEFS